MKSQLTPEILEKQKDSFKKSLFFLKDDILIDRILDKLISIVYIKDMTLTNHVVGRTSIGKILRQTFLHQIIILINSIIESLIYYYIFHCYEKEANSLINKKEENYIPISKIFETKDGQEIFLIKKSTKITKNKNPKFAAMIDFLQARQLFDISFLKDLRSCAEVRNQIHIYNSQGTIQEISNKDLDRHIKTLNSTLGTIREKILSNSK